MRNGFYVIYLNKLDNTDGLRLKLYDKPDDYDFNFIHLLATFQQNNRQFI